MMLQLPHGRRCGKMSVYPKNWKEAGASLKKDWYINYRFYDEKGNKKQVPVKGMNSYHTLQERREMTQILLDNEINLLKSGYNPITGLTTPPPEEEEINNGQDYIIHPDAPFGPALQKAFELMEGEPNTITNAKTTLKYFRKAAADIGKDMVPLSSIARRHILMILARCEKNRPERWSDNQFNEYRKNLMGFYKILKKHEAVECNLLNDIDKKGLVDKIPRLLTQDEREKIANHLSARHPVFYNYIHLFFHSGSRTKELMRVKGSDLDLANQRYKCIIYKRQKPKQVWRIIKDIAMPFWEFATKGMEPDHYVFSKGFRPGPKPGNRFYISMTWRRLVKKELGIDVDFYKLKALNLDELAEILRINEAQRLAEHTTPVVTMKNYAINEEVRQAERIKKVKNAFV